jgi:hypothetical protein
MTIMGRPDSVWRLTSCLWNLCVRYLLGFPKADLVGRLFAIVRKLIVTQNRKQKLAIDNGAAKELVTAREARLPLVRAQKLILTPNQPPEQKRGSRFDSCQVVPLYYIRRKK